VCGVCVGGGGWQRWGLPGGLQGGVRQQARPVLRRRASGAGRHPLPQRPLQLPADSSLTCTRWGVGPRGTRSLQVERSEGSKVYAGDTRGGTKGGAETRAGAGRIGKNEGAVGRRLVAQEKVVGGRRAAGVKLGWSCHGRLMRAGRQAGTGAAGEQPAPQHSHRAGAAPRAPSALQPAPFIS
jgi:hypothetical protein